MLYRLFELPHAPSSTLVLIGTLLSALYEAWWPRCVVHAVLCDAGIANRINLPELLLPKLVLGGGRKALFSRLLFEPYSEPQLVAILSSRCTVPTVGTDDDSEDDAEITVLPPGTASGES